MLDFLKTAGVALLAIAVVIGGAILYVLAATIWPAIVILIVWCVLALVVPAIPFPWDLELGVLPGLM